jgi:hypothetical protein
VTPAAKASERLWRLRKDHAWIDARLRDRAAAGVELQFFYAGTLVVARTWSSREAALADADDQRRDFERAGWNTHW